VVTADGVPLPTVLVVDDDATVRRVLSLTLESAGFRVLTADDGRHALAVLASARDVVDLILTDVVMPEMSGVTLAQQVFAQDATARVCLMSGYLDDRAKMRRDIGHPVTFVQKPFDVDELVAHLRSELGAE
jgi:DNA-binding NtrC family response regulator